MKSLHLLIPRHFSFSTSHHSSLWLDSIMDELKKNFDVKITWFYYSPTKISQLKLKENEDVIQIHDFGNAVDVVKAVQPDLILDSEFPTLIDLSFLAASKNRTFYVRKYSNHKMFKVPLKFRSTFSHLNEQIPSEENKKTATRRSFYFMKYRFFIKSVLSSKLGFSKKLAFLWISFKWNFITEHPLLNPNIQADLEILNSTNLKENLLKHGYAENNLITAGNPMFDSLFTKRNNPRKDSAKKTRILFAPFQRYGGAHENLQEKITRDIIESIMMEKEHYELTVKLHPSFHNYKYFVNIVSSIDSSIELHQEGSIEKYVENCDIYTSNGIVSSSALSGLILKKPVIFCDFSNIYNYDVFKNIILECKDKESFLELLKNSHEINQQNFQNIETFLEENYFKTDGLAAKRVANAINSILNNKD